MTGPDQASAEAEARMREAAAWFARMRAPDAEDSRAAFEAWLAAPENREAYSRVAEVFALGKVLGPRPQGTEADSRGEAAALAARPAGEEATSSRPSGKGIRLLAGIALFAAVAAIGSRNMIQPAGQHSSGDRLADVQAETLSTAGERKLIRLPDGSSVALSPHTLLRTSFDADRRLLRLERGEARFHVAHDRRPFTVAAGNGTVTARGTVFDVALVGSEQVTVRLISGKVDVSLPRSSRPAHSGSNVIRLSPGEAVTFAHSDAPSAATAAPQRQSAAPPVQEAVGTIREFEAVRVADVVAEANGMSARPIRLSGKGLGEARISGRFRIDDTAILADRLSLLFDAAVDQSDPSQIVLRPR